jgi:hypothetical protein
LNICAISKEVELEEMANFLSFSVLLVVGCVMPMLVSSLPQSLDNLQYPKKSFIESLLTRPIFAEGENSDLMDLKYPQESLISSIVTRVISTFSRIRVSCQEESGKSRKNFEKICSLKEHLVVPF